MAVLRTRSPVSEIFWVKGETLKKVNYISYCQKFWNLRLSTLVKLWTKSLKLVILQKETTPHMKAPSLSSLVLDGRGPEVIMVMTHATFPRAVEKVEAKAWNILDHPYITYLHSVLQIDIVFRYEGKALFGVKLKLDVFTIFKTKLSQQLTRHWKTT